MDDVLGTLGSGRAWQLQSTSLYRTADADGQTTGRSERCARFFPELAKKIGGGMEQWYQEDVEEYMEQWAKAVPENPKTGKSGLERLKEEGAWEDESRDPFYEPFAAALTEEELADSQADAETGVITKDGTGIGIMMDGKAVRGFKTPSRKFEIRSLFVSQTGLNKDTTELIKASSMKKTKPRPKQHEGYDVNIEEMPVWMQPIEHQEIADDELIMTSFKWNVHNHGRTMNLKWLAEICLLYTSPSPRDLSTSRMPSSA